MKKQKGTRAQYDAFIEVYEKGGYTKASEEERGKLHNSVKRLEVALGVKLFDDNNKKGAIPTADGEILYNGIKEPFAIIEQLEKQLWSTKTIRIAISSVFSTEQFSSFIKDFCDKITDLKIEILTVDGVEALKNSKADFVISLRADLIDKGLTVTNLYEDEMVILQSEDLEFYQDDTFASFDFVVINGMCDLFCKTTGAEIKPILKVDTLEQVYSTVRHGKIANGLYWLSAIDEKSLVTDKLKISKLSEILNIDPVEIVSCAYRKGKLTNEQKEFLSRLEQHCKDLRQPIKNIKLLK